MNSWEVTDANGVSHSISYQLKGGKNNITVDGETYKAKSSNWFINVIDYEIDLPGANCHIVAIGRKVDLAVNGVYKSNGNAYEPVSNTPAWTWVLVGLSFLGGYLFAGIIGCCIGCIMSVFYLQFALQKKIGGVIGSFIGFVVIIAIIFAAKLMMLGY